MQSRSKKEESQVLVRSDIRIKPPLPDDLRAWQWAGRLAFVLTLAGLIDWTIALIPFRLGTMEWEFGTITAIMSGLPLIAIGFTGLLASELARGRRAGILVTSGALLVLALLILASLVVYGLNVPIALKTVDGVAHLGISKAIAKTMAMGGLFFVAFLVASIAGIRHASRPR